MADLNYLYSLLSFSIGVAAGYQGIYERYERDSPRASVTRWGILYLITRGALPATVFAGLYSYELIKTFPWAQALAYGAGVEVLLRSRFYVRQVREEAGNIQELLGGPFDLLRWYQDLFLESIDYSRSSSRKKFVKTNLPENLSFDELCDSVITHRGAFHLEHPELEQNVVSLRAEFNREKEGVNDPTELERLEAKYRMKLGYRILCLVGENGFKTLFSG